MVKIDKNLAPENQEIEAFIKDIDFNLPKGFIEFFKDSNGADLYTDEDYLLLWKITEMIQLNEDYSVEKYAPEFFIFGSDGGDIAYAIEKETSYIYELPFIGMSKAEAIFRSHNFTEFIESFR